MLKITYEIIPFGLEDHENRRVIATQMIGLQKNEGDVGTYVSNILHDGKGNPPEVSLVGPVTSSRDLGCFHLLRKLLNHHCGVI